MGQPQAPYKLVICHDGPQGKYTVYFINESDQPLRSVRLSGSGPCFADEPQTAEGAPRVKAVGTVQPHAFIALEADEEACFESEMEFEAIVETDQGRQDLHYRIPEHYPVVAALEPVDALGKHGWVVPQS